MPRGSAVAAQKKAGKGKKSKDPAGIVRQERLARQLTDYDGRPKGKYPVKNLTGRAKGAPNNISRLTREAIFDGLSRCGGHEGMVGFVIRATEDNLKNGVAMLNMITPRIVDAVITRHDVIFQTIAEVDKELASHGLPTSQEIFKLDYKGSTVLDAEDMAVIEAAAEKE
jgi:hypothetical protein